MVVTPLQLANAYATFANGGTLWAPRLAAEVIDANGSEGRATIGRRAVAAPGSPAEPCATRSSPGSWAW